MTTISMSTEDFGTLSSWADSYGVSRGLSWSIRELIERIELANGLVRRFLAVRWRDSNMRKVGSPGTDWPPQQQTTLLRYTNPWTYSEVMDAVRAQATNPFQVEVTTDRTVVAGWTDIDTYFVVVP